MSASDRTLLSRLERGIEALGQDASTELCERCLAYLGLLVKWNRAYNLSGIRDPEQMLSHHILDSLSVRPYILGRRCLDVGTGAGLPGLILALSLPETHWVLLDSNRKKIRFLNQVKLELKVGNVEVRHGRVEEFQAAQPFSIIISRALGPLARFWKMTEKLRNEDTRLLAMKGTLPREEMAELGKNVGITVHKLKVPGLDEERHLLMMQQGKEP
jgi:16S rRNA (guanine527-N7)-methyltransferase